MTEIEDQYAEWAHARAALGQIFGRARAASVREQCHRIFGLNLLAVWPLVAEYARGAPPEIAANIIAIINSEIPEVGRKIIAQVLATAAKEVKAAMLDQHTALMAAHLFVLGATDAYPVFQLLVYLKKQAQWRLVGSILAVAGQALAKASKQSYEYIQREAGAHETRTSLDIVLDEHKERHEYDLSLLEALPVLFRPDPAWKALAAEYESLRSAILGESESESESEAESQGNEPAAAAAPTPAPTIDTTNRTEVALKKKIYLTIMSSLSTQEACHKLLALGNRETVARMLYETCKQQKIYNKSFGSIGYHLCRASREWPPSFELVFSKVYASLEEASTPEIRNMGTLSGYLLASESIGWGVLKEVQIDEEHSTPSNRIYLQALFEELRREIGLPKISKQLEALPGIIPLKGDTSALIFSINYFTAIKMGPLTDGMRQELERRRREHA